MTAKEKNMLDNVIYTYTSGNHLEEENRTLKESINKLREELELFKKTPLMVCEVYDIIGNNAIIRIPNGNQFAVNIAPGCEKLNPSDIVLAEQKNLTVLKKLDISRRFNVEKFVIIERPNINWKDIGGLDKQINEIKEVIELPLTNPKLFKKVGIDPPKGILFYGPPGTGKTLLAKAAAASTKSTFIVIVGSELVQKFIGEGAKLVKEIFELARKKAPAIVFIDEIDSLAARRMELGTSGEREVNRTFMQLLAELDGFKPLDNVKIIGATNRRDILDPAILRPGRLDRQIHITLPSKEGRIEILKIHTGRMTLNKDVDRNVIVDKMADFSGAEINAVCTEAGYFAIRDLRTVIIHNDFIRAIEKVRHAEEVEGEDYLGMFG